MVARTAVIGGSTGSRAESRKYHKPDVERRCVLETDRKIYKQAAYNKGKRAVQGKY